ncbi:MAG TPA: O-antigen ligase family protein [Candidatus Dormibacteraeota bacterium]|nr:O-antigen ligase family protein [Candidatus Dormibacteraeota bacterium]
MFAWAAVVVLATYLIFIGGSWSGIYSAPLRIITMSLAAATLLVWVLVAWKRPAWRPRSVLWPAILASLASLAISTVFSRVPRVSLEYLGYAIVLAALYLLLVRLFADPFFRRRLVTLASMWFVVVSVVFVASVVGRWIDWWALLGHFAIPPLRPNFEGLSYGNPSAALTIVALLAVPPLATFSSSSRRGIAVIAAIVVTVALVALISGSRSGWFAIGTTVLLVVIGSVVSSTSRQILRNAAASVLRGRRGRIAMIVTVTALLLTTAVLAPIIIRRAGEGGEELRLQFAIVALRLLASSPIVGTGPGTWVIERGAETRPPEADYYVPYAHDLEVQTLAELGIVGMVAGAVLVFSVGWLLWRAARGADEMRRRWAIAGAIGLVYFLLHQVFDFYANMPAILAAAVIPVAYLDATASPPPKPVPQPRVNRLLWTAACAVVGIAVVGLIAQEIPALAATQAVSAADSGDWAAADAPARRAAAEDPEIQSYNLIAGLTASHAGDHEAAAAYFQAVLRQTDLPEAWLDLAAEQAALGRRDEAVTSLNKALRLGWERTAIALAAGDLALRLGEQETAVGALSSAVIERPSLAGDPWWRTDPARRGVFAQVVDTAIGKASAQTVWEIALVAGQTQRARQIVATLPDVYFGDVISAWNGDPAAANMLFDRCAAQPLELTLVTWCARIADRDGNVLLTDRFRAMAEAVVSGSSSFGGELRVNLEPSVASIEGDAAFIWGTFTYRRPTPADPLVSSLVHLKLE